MFESNIRHIHHINCSKYKITMISYLLTNATLRLFVLFKNYDCLKLIIK